MNSTSLAAIRAGRLLACFGVAAAALLVPGVVRPARACGGLFCNSAQPVNQAAERIIFSHNTDGTVTAIIEIQYQGPSESFAWVLPVPGVPDVEVSSVAAFDRLQQATNPLYTLNTTFEQCEGDDSVSFGNGVGQGRSAGADGGTAVEDGGSVNVLASGSVGPFDWEAIMVNPGLSDPADVALEWLMTNGYDVTSLGPEVLRPYLEDGLNLLAFRLNKTAEEGSIRPIRVTYDGVQPFIPIIPTAVAANDDMGIMVWVVGDSRAIPRNYKSLVLNEALLDWFNPMSRYDDVVTAAADEAMGQGFVTEMAGDSQTLEGVVVQSWERDQWLSVQNDTTSDALTLYQNVRNNFPGWDGVDDALRAAVTLPDSVTYEDFLNCPNCYIDTPGVVIDRMVLLQQIYQMVIKPMYDTEDLLQSRPYITRFYTTMSADEMTVDPMFDFNADLDDVSTTHTADQLIKCDGSFVITLPQGDMVYGESSGVWPIDIEDQPANLKILQLSTEGQGEEVTDNSDMIRNLLGATGPQPDPNTVAGEGGGSAGIGGSGVVAGSGGDGAGTTDTSMDSTKNACGCRVPGASTGAPLAPLALFALALGARLLRRRRQPRG